jgi:hypothetical protein
MNMKRYTVYISETRFRAPQKLAAATGAISCSGLAGNEQEEQEEG